MSIESPELRDNVRCNARLVKKAIPLGSSGRGRAGRSVGSLEQRLVARIRTKVLEPPRFIFGGKGTLLGVRRQEPSDEIDRGILAAALREHDRRIVRELAGGIDLRVSLRRFGQ